jgi:hypothetical protein
MFRWRWRESRSLMKTVFVVGAGASKEVGLPLGSELKRDIAGLLDIRYDDFGSRRVSGSGEIDAAFRIAAGQEEPSSRDINPYLHASWRIRDAMPQALSIDNYIDCQNGDARLELAGKLAIALAILRAEASSMLYVDQRREANPKPKFENLAKTWYGTWWQLLSENCRLADLPDRLGRVTFVTFNYDRCIEQFLLHACKNYYPLDDGQAAEVLKSLTVLHPYGSVGALPWMQHQNAIAFGQMPQSAEKLVSVARGLKTFTEGTDDEASDIKLIRERVSTADRIVFLGFAFHELNVQLLLPKRGDDNSGSRSIYGTASGISPSDVEQITMEVTNLIPTARGKVFLRRDLLCHALLPEYWRSLRFN